MTDAERVEHLRDAIKRLASNDAFYVATSKIDPETYARMRFAEGILMNLTIEAATHRAEYETLQRYDPTRLST